jgi:hypothetical protein
MGGLEFTAVILFAWLIGFKPSDLRNMVVLSVLLGCGIGAGVLIFMVGREFLLSPNGPYAIAAILSACFFIWKLGVTPPQPHEESPLERRVSALAHRPDRRAA